jgi:protein-S-isoprenylcysteine O-methyltransferase Ste14
MMAQMAMVTGWLGTFAGGLLLTLLVATLITQGRFRLWPTPGEKTWQSYVFWPLFRGLNALCVLAVLVTVPGGTFFGLPLWLRIVAALVAVGAVGTFVAAFRLLGRDNSYGASDGLVTGGIYQWSRNPQNAMLMVVYACLAVVSDTGLAWVLCSAMVAVYFVMVLCEEPWLEAIYGAPYRSYCRQVPRFLAVRRLWTVAPKAANDNP